MKTNGKDCSENEKGCSEHQLSYCMSLGKLCKQCQGTFDTNNALSFISHVMELLKMCQQECRNYLITLVSLVAFFAISSFVCSVFLVKKKSAVTRGGGGECRRSGFRCEGTNGQEANSD